MKHFKSMIFAILAVLIVSAVVFAAGDLLRVPSNFFTGQTPVQKFAPNATQVKTIPAGGYVNFSTATLTAVSAQCLNAGTPAACTVRIGGYVTGSETDGFVAPAAGTGEIWIGNGVTKIGIKATSGYTVPIQKQ